jgi:DNA-binding PadR family transcriptional regulator
MRKSTPLAFGPVAVLHAVADGNRFGFDIMDVTGLTSGTVYPALDRLESLGYLSSKWEDARAARREKRPARRYFDLTSAGADALAEALTRYKNLKPVSLAAWRIPPTGHEPA